MEDPNKYNINYVKYFNDVLWIVRKDFINGGKKWFILPIINANLQDPCRYGLNPYELGLGARAYGINKTKWKVNYDKQNSTFYWKLIDKNSDEEKDRILNKLSDKFSEYMSIYGEPDEIDIKASNVSAKILFYLKIYGVVFIDQSVKEAINISKVKLLCKLSSYFFNTLNPCDNKKFNRKYSKIKKAYPEYNYLQACFAVFSTYINEQNGFVGKGSLKLMPIKGGKFSIIETKNNCVSIMTLGTNFAHQECLRLLSTINIWNIIKGISQEYFSSDYINRNSEPFQNSKFTSTLPHIVSSSSDIFVKYHETKIKNKTPTPKLEKPHTTSEKLYKSVEKDGFNLGMNLNKSNVNDAFNILITDQEKSAIHLGFVLFSNTEPIKKLINKYFTNTNSTANETVAEPYGISKFNKIIMKYWRTWSDGITLHTSDILMYEAIPHCTMTNKKILLRTYLQTSDYNKFSFRFGMQICNYLSLINSMENIETIDRIKQAAILESNFEQYTIKDDIQTKKPTEYETELFKSLLALLNWKYLDTTELVKTDNNKKIEKYKLLVLELPKDIKEMYGIYDY